MANYHEYALMEATDPAAVGLGFGDTKSGLYSRGPEGDERICISLGAKRIDWGAPRPPGPERDLLGPGGPPDGHADWVSCSPAVARELLKLLKIALGEP